ncbi:MAG: hypothetical protein E7Z88_02425 [Cyanobacteria bacterium SIG27]|nr:hypothetical protein [Cyanobacteria bacterium SIG27]
MLNPELWIQGGTTMAVGMGIVFSFLVIMVFAMMILTRVVNWLNKVCPVATPVEKQVKKVTSNDDAEIAVAIALATRGV